MILLPMLFPVALPLAAQAPARISGELRQWHKVTLDVTGPEARETDSDPNPFLDYRFTVRFTHESGSPRYEVPGYFAADGNAANTSATAGNHWRAHLSPDKTGRWTYEVAFLRGKNLAVDATAAGQPVAPVHGLTGSFRIAASNRRGRDLRAKGRLQYADGHFLRFAGTREYFLKAGPDAPETFLACRDFDGTQTRKTPLKTWESHVSDWRPGDPTWQGGAAGAQKGKGIIGALNYLAAKGLNAFSFLTYNAGGDGDNVWPFVERDDKLHYDCSKLDQWQIVFDHAQAVGLYLHFKLQETENDDHRVGAQGETARVPEALDGGDLGVERKLYLRELIARFAHALALNWNLGEENTQSAEQQRDMAAYIRATDPYKHPIVVHTFPDWQDRVYPSLLGAQSVLTGASVQTAWNRVHQRTLQWVEASKKAGKPWVVANDEQGPAALGVPPDPGYAGFAGKDSKGNTIHTLHDVRKYSLWGNLMAGGAGVEYYFGYDLPQNDLVAEDFRSRDRSWDYCRIALDFFRTHRIPFWEMSNANALVGNASHENTRYCLSKPGEIYLVYLPTGGSAELDLSSVEGRFQVRWFNPRQGGALRPGPGLNGGARRQLGDPPGEPAEDWLAVVRRTGR